MKGFEHLLPSQLADVGRVLGKSDVESREFEWRDGSYEPYVHVPELRHAPTNYRFQFSYSRRADVTGYGGPRRGGNHHVKFTPGRLDEWEEHHALEWPQVPPLVDHWLENLARELGAAPFWEAVAAAGAGLSGSAEGEGDSPFSEDEIEEIRTALDDALARIGELETLQDAERAFVRAEFDELKETLQVLKRRGWAKMAMGTFLNVAVREIVPQGIMKQIWQDLRDYLASLPGLLPPG